MSESDLLEVLRAVSGRSYARELRRWVHSTAELPLRKLLESLGIAIHEDPAQLAQGLGLRVSEGPNILIKTVLRGGAAEQAGFAAGDEWLAVEVGKAASPSSWRLHKLDDLMLYAAGQSTVRAWLVRDKRILQVALKLPRQQCTWRLSMAREKLPGTWPGR